MIAGLERERKQRWESFGHRLAIGLGGAVLLALLVAYAGMLGSGSAGVTRTDFVPVFSAAHLAGHGHGDAIYDLNQLGSFERALVKPLHVKDGVMPFLYAPFVALLLTPVAGLPYLDAYLVWLAVSLALLLWTLRSLQGMAGLRGKNVLLFWAASLSFLPVFVGLAQGQMAVLLLAALTACLLSLRRGQPIVAGVILAVVAVKVPYLLPVLLVLLVQRRWRTLGACAISLAALALLSFAMLGTGAVTGYIRTLVQASGWQQQIGGFEPVMNHSLRGFLGLLFPADVAGAAWILCSALLCVVLASFAHRCRSIELPFALAVTAGLLISPHVLIHDLTLLLLPAAVALQARTATWAGFGAVALFGYLAVLVGAPAASFTHLQLSVVAIIVLLAWLWREGARPSAEDAPLPAASRPLAEAVR